MTLAFNLSLAGYLVALLLAAANLFSKEQRRFAAAATIVLGAGALAQSIFMNPAFGVSNPQHFLLFGRPKATSKICKAITNFRGDGFGVLMQIHIQ